LQVATEQGTQYFQVQGSSVQGLSSVPILQRADEVPLESDTAPSIQPMQPMQPMQPIQPMQPMQMGNMRMQMNPMQMKMGDLELSMGDASPTETPAASSAPKFCSQCGQRLQSGDRFCASCGHRVSAAPNS
jgi:NADH pyrophosphatase NudC (nudix superfamily)